MIPSLYQIDFIHGTIAVRLLDLGELLTSEPLPQWQQTADHYSLIGAPWGDSEAKGGAVTALSWGVIRQHASHAALRSYCMSDSADIQSGTTGTLRVSIAAGDSWDIVHVTALSVMTIPRLPCASFQTVSAYVFTGGELAMSPAPPTPGDRIALASMPIRMVADSEGFWCEVGMVMADEITLTGNAADGWTDALGLFTVVAQQSTLLTSWTEGQFDDCAGGPVDNGDGSHTHWLRHKIPAYYSETMVDLTISSDRYGKSLESLTVMSADVSLSYPYALPSDASRLQADLRSAGFTGATVTSVSSALVAQIKNHTVGGISNVAVTMSGSNVVDVSWRGTTVPVSYPYAMPSQQAALQAALRAQGIDGAVVTLHAATWTITLPNRLAAGLVRDIVVIISPGDPFPYWDMYGVYQGLSPATWISGSSGNVRTPAGAALVEADKQFARLEITLL